MDIILLIFLCNKIAALAEQKKVSKVAWILKTILFWIAGEAFGILLLVTLLAYMGHLNTEDLQQLQEMSKEMLFIICASYLGGYLGYLLARKRLEDLPDANDRIE